MKKTGLVWDPLFQKHLQGAGHPESPNRLRAVYQTIIAESLDKTSEKIAMRPASDEEITLIHDRSYLEIVRAEAGKEFVSLDPDTWMTEHSFDAAINAAGGGIELVDAVAKGVIDNGYALVRPPGHHAEAGRSSGFCLFNNIAIAAEYLIKKYGMKKVAIVDFDVHHGNGTNNAFYGRRDVLYISTHQTPLFPGSGHFSELGAGEGEGHTVNIPLSARLTDADYYELYQRAVKPILEEYQPEIILVSTGMDIHQMDPIGGMKLTSEGICALVRLLERSAEKLCNGKIALFLEGGYNLEALSEAVALSIKVLQGESVGFREPPRDYSAGQASNYLFTLKKHQSKYWNCIDNLEL